MTKEYIIYWDILKAFAIFLVIWAHAMQFLAADDTYFYRENVTQVIVSSYMPLFMIVSGFFSYSLMNKRFIEVLKMQFVRRIVSSIIWHVGVDLLLFVATLLLISVVTFLRCYLIV